MNWNRVRIESFCDTGAGGTPSRAEAERYFGGTIPWVKSGELREDTIVATEECITQAGLDESAAKLVPAGALLVALYGATVGRIATLGIDAATNQAVCHIVPRDSTIDRRFLFYALRTCIPGWLSRRVGGAQPNISQQIIKETEILLPPLAEQRRIADVLDRAEALRAKRRAALAQLDSLTQSLFLDLFGDPVRNERCWPFHNFSDVALFENGDRSSNYPSGDDIQTEGILFLSTKNIVENRLNLSNAVFITPEKFCSLSRGKARRMDLIITLRGTLGSCCIFDCPHDTAFINAQMMLVRPSENVTPKFLHALLTSAQAQDRFARIGHGAAVPQLTATQLAKLPIPIPPIELQREFARRVTAVETLRTAHRASLAELDALFATLQHRAFRGEL